MDFSRDLSLRELAGHCGGVLPVEEMSEQLHERLALGAEQVGSQWRRHGVIYGVTTGYGESCVTAIPAHLVEELPAQLLRFHGCGLGATLSPQEVRAVLAARTISLCRGFSGVRPELVDRLLTLMRLDLLPRIPEEGSVGASGDLTPLSYVAAVLCGEREVHLADGPGFESASAALQRHGLEPLRLLPKEGLAMMNGTSVMTGMAVLNWARAWRLAHLSARSTALAVEGLMGNPRHYDEDLFELKAHPGQQTTADLIRQGLGQSLRQGGAHRLQDRYSLRCAPHVLGVLLDGLVMFEPMIEAELNSVNDNPLIDPLSGKLMHGGHFYGGHIAFAMDALKTATANVADLLDRQILLLTDRHANHGLPANLSGAAPERASINHGLKALSIGASAWTAEALKGCMPASVFSRSTECHNQDKVSMGTIAARDMRRILELSEQVLCAQLVAVTQAVRLRLLSGDLAEAQLAPATRQLMEGVQRHVAHVTEDRPLEAELRALLQALRAGELDLPEDRP